MHRYEAYFHHQQITRLILEERHIQENTVSDTLKLDWNGVLPTPIDAQVISASREEKESKKS